MRLLVSCIQRFPFLKNQKEMRCFSNAVPPLLKNSYFFKNGTIPLTSLTVGDALDRSAESYGDHVVYISHHQGISKTYLELRNEAERLASGLIACGLRKGDRLAVYSPNCYEWPLTQLAAAKAGITLVAINFASQPLELEHCLRKTGCKAVISYDKLKHHDYYEVFNKIIPNLKNSNPLKLHCEKLPTLESIIMLSNDNKEGMILFKDIMSMGNKESDAILSQSKKLVQFDDPVNIQFTSGTTGVPKAAMLTHHNVINGSNATVERIVPNLEDPIITCSQVPFFHSFAVMVSLFMPMVRKQTIVIPSSTHDAVKSLEAIEKYRCNTVIGTPTMFIDLLKTHEDMKSDISSLKKVIVGGASTPEGLLKSLHKDLAIPTIQIGYGLSETSAGFAFTRHGSDLDGVLNGFVEPIAGVEVKIVDNQNQVVPNNIAGEICARGYTVFPGYWEDKEKTAQAIDKTGWFHTGDIGVMNEEGWLKIVGRFKDIVIRGGENIYVSEIESFFSDYPAVLEVHVCGVPDDRLGEELCCWIRVKPGMNLTEEDVRNFCQGKISYYKIPRYILFVDEFPKTNTGKVKKYEMVKLSKERLSL